MINAGLRITMTSSSSHDTPSPLGDLTFDLLDDELKQQLDDLAVQARQASQGAAGPIVSEVGDVPEDELERVDADSFRPTKVLFISPLLSFPSLSCHLKLAVLLFLRWVVHEDELECVDADSFRPTKVPFFFSSYSHLSFNSPSLCFLKQAGPIVSVILLLSSSLSSFFMKINSFIRCLSSFFFFPYTKLMDFIT